MAHRRRDRRQSTGKPVELTWDDINHILLPIARYQILDTETLIAVNVQHKHLSESWIRRRLKEFYHEENTSHGGPYLDRTRLLPKNTLDISKLIREIGHSPDLHFLTEHAHAALDTWVPKRRPSIIQFGHRTSHHLRHKVYDACGHASLLDLGVLTTDIAPVFWYHIQESNHFPKKTKALADPFSIPLPMSRSRNGKKPAHYEPDDLLGFEYPSVHHRIPYRFCPIEIDGGTEPNDSKTPRNSSLGNKFDDILALLDTGGFREHLGLPNKSIYPLFLFESQRRMENNIELLRRKHKERNRPGADRFGFKCLQFKRPSSLVPMPDPDLFLKPWRTIHDELDLTQSPTI